MTDQHTINSLVVYPYRANRVLWCVADPRFKNTASDKGQTLGGSFPTLFDAAAFAIKARR